MPEWNCQKKPQEQMCEGQPISFLSDQHPNLVAIPTIYIETKHIYMIGFCVLITLATEFIFLHKYEILGFLEKQIWKYVKV